MSKKSKPPRRFSTKPPAGSLSTDVGPEDGLDPRLEPRHPAGRVTNRKALQLCRQVERALSLALEGDVLRDLTVQSVVPAPDSSRLLVALCYHGTDQAASEEVHAAVRANHAKLRGEVAAAIHRRKTPELTFVIVRDRA